jgi:hypothetical protein
MSHAAHALTPRLTPLSLFGDLAAGPLAKDLEYISERTSPALSHPCSSRANITRLVANVLCKPLGISE